MERGMTHAPSTPLLPAIDAVSGGVLQSPARPLNTASSSGKQGKVRDGDPI